MSEPIDIKTHGGDPLNEKGITQVEDSHNLDNDAKLAAYKAAAMEAETAEQQSGVIQAVKEYPMAAFWAFVMSCTIVSHFYTIFRRTIAANAIFRSWSPIAFSSWVISSPYLRSKTNSVFRAPMAT